MIAERSNLAGETIEKIIQWLDKIGLSSNLPILVLDVDETIFINYHKHWLTWKNWIEGKKFPTEELNLSDDNYLPVISFADFCASGGSMVYRNFFKTDELFNRYNNENVMDPEFNRNLQPVGNVLEAVKVLNSLIQYYLTARAKTVKELTAEELAKYNFPHAREVICAGEEGAYLEPHGFKIEELRKLQLQHPGKKLILIDDSVSTCQAINELNDPNLEAILFSGAATPKAKYPLAKNWEDIIDYMLRDLELLRSRILLQLLG